MIFFFFLYDVIQIQTFTIRQTHTFSWFFWCFVIGMKKFFFSSLSNMHILSLNPLKMKTETYIQNQ